MDTHDNALQIPNPQHFPLKAYHMPRQRIDKLLEAATRCKLVFVLAGAGYGKTQAVRHYIEEQGEAIVRWLQLDENDNIAARYWEKLVYNISFDNPDLADKLRKFGFPDTSARFNQFGEILKSAEHRAHRTFLVLDDFHLIHSKEALAFAQRCAYLEIPGACVILISRKEPEINVVSLFAKGQVHIITEDELRFADIEISEYLRRQNVPFSADGLANIIEATRGWALAVQLLALSLKRMPENLEFAIDVMKQNIFKLMEIEAFEDFSPEAKKTMVKLSLISSLPLTALQKLFCDDSFLQGAPGIESFVWFDSLTGEDRIHPLYGEFLRSKQDILSFEEKQDTYRQAAKWCYENNFSLDAVRYYFMLQDYKCVLDILLSYPFKQSYSACEYFFGILKELDQSGAEEKAQEDRSVLLLKNLFLPLLLLWMDRYEEAESRCFAAIASWEHSSSPLAPSILCAAHSCLSYINLYTCTFTHKYDFFDHLKKAVEHFSKSSLPPIDIAGPFGVADIRSFACLIGEGASLLEFDKFVEAAKKTAPYIAQTAHNMYFGYDDLAACELAFYKNHLKTAKKCAHEAILKARAANQHSIEVMAAFYLFRIASAEGDYAQIKELFKNKDDSPGNPNFWNRRFLYELAIGFLYAHIGLPQMMPSWLLTEEKDSVFEVSIPARELICGAKYYFAAKKYSQALTLLCNSYPRKKQERFLLGELTLMLLSAVARIKTGDEIGAARDFDTAYEKSFDGVFEMPFVELGRELPPLASALRRAGSKIPDWWLKMIGRKASIYAKKLTVVTNAFKEEQRIKDTVQLSERETEVLNDLYHGLSREEIAANRYLSINTVKKVLQSIFIKLDANNSVDAIRIGLENKLIE